MSHLPEVAVIILNFNTADYLRSYLPSVLATTYGNTRVIVADNGSTDQSRRVLLEEFPEVETLLFDENYGFAGGYNKAIDQIESPYTVLLNSDVKVDPEWLTPLVQLTEKDQTIGALQPKIKDLKSPDTFEYAGAAGGWIDALGFPFCRGRVFDSIEKDIGQYNNEDQPVFWASGAALFVRTELYKKLGGLDSDFFAHMEEIDFCWRLQNAGYRLACCGKSQIYHLGGGTLDSLHPRKMFLNYRNNLWMLSKNLHSKELFPVVFMRLVLDGISAIKHLMDGKWKAPWIIFKAHIAFYNKGLSMRRKTDLGKRKLRRELEGMTTKKVVFEFYFKKHHSFTNLV